MSSTFFRDKIKKDPNFLTEEIYTKIYPSGSQFARMYGLRQLHKLTSNNKVPLFRPIVSSIGTHNCKLPRYLSDVFTPLLPLEYCAKEIFIFLEELRQVRQSSKFMVSFESLFTNIPLDETTDIVVILILEKHPERHIFKSDLKNCLFLLLNRLILF